MQHTPSVHQMGRPRALHRYTLRHHPACVIMWSDLHSNWIHEESVARDTSPRGKSRRSRAHQSQELADDNKKSFARRPSLILVQHDFSITSETRCIIRAWCERDTSMHILGAVKTEIYLHYTFALHVLRRGWERERDAAPVLGVGGGSPD